MDLTHQFTVPASVEDAWHAFNDLERVAPCFPGATLTSYDGATFAGLVKVKLGPISLQYSGTGRFVERDEASHRAVIEAKGKDKRGNGTATALVTAELSAVDDAQTGVTVRTDLNVTGRPAQFGRGVMQDVSDRLLGQFSACLEEMMSEHDEAADPAGETDGAGSLARAEAAQPKQPVRAGPVQPAPPSRPAEAARPQAQLDLGSTVLPVVLKRSGPYLVATIGIVVALGVLRRIVRRR